MKRFHIAPQGPAPCQASKRPCPIGGSHYESLEAAQVAFEAQHSTFGRPSSVPSVEVEPEAFAGGRYLGAHVAKAAVDPFLADFREKVGAKAKAMEAAKAARDRGEVYHLTVVTPPEMRAFKGSGFSPPPNASLRLLGLGKAVDGDNEAWFIVCESAAIAAWREASGLPPKDLHITLGFRNKDVHTKPKGRSSLVG